MLRLIHGVLDAPIHGDDRRWGDPAVAAAKGPIIATDVVDSIRAGTQQERFDLWQRVLGAGPLGPNAQLSPQALSNGHVFPRSILETLAQERAFADKMRLITPFRPENASDAPGFARASFMLRYRDPRPIDELFNHPAGMRGHYAVNPAVGDLYTQDIITMLLPLLEVLVAEWRTVCGPHWLIDNADARRASLLAGKIWLEPHRPSGTLRDHGLGNINWVGRDHPSAERRRRDFIAAVGREEGGDQAAVDAFLREAADPAKGIMGLAPTLGVGDWKIQRAGTAHFGADSCLLQVSGAFVNPGGQIFTPARKKYRALSIQHFGFT